jgi:phosphatidylglycerol:prolipoprotein diacylglycerol transferase
MNFWNHIYEQFDPVAISLGFVTIHWYGIMYLLALFSALWFAKYMIKKDAMNIPEDTIDSFFIWVEIGVILGARLGYILFYDTNASWYLTQPWQIFNPFVDGEFVGIRGMSYHGAIIGAMIAMVLFARRYPTHIFKLLDIVALSVPVGYLFGRIGNFLNQELIGKTTDVAWGIYVDGVLRHPSQLYEAFLEGVVVAVIIYIYRSYKRFDGELIVYYGVLYGISRFIAEIYREPDYQLGYVCCDSISMGQAMSLGMILFSLSLYKFIEQASRKRDAEVKI